MKPKQSKERIVHVTDPQEIETVKRGMATGELEAPRGHVDGGVYAQANEWRRMRERSDSEG